MVFWIILKNWMDLIKMMLKIHGIIITYTSNDRWIVLKFVITFKEIYEVRFHNNVKFIFSLLYGELKWKEN